MPRLSAPSDSRRASSAPASVSIVSPCTTSDLSPPAAGTKPYGAPAQVVFVRSSQSANDRRLPYSARSTSNARWGIDRSLYEVFSLPMRLPCRLTMIMLSPGVWNRPTISGSSRSTHSYWMGDMKAAFMWMSGAPRRLDTSTSTPWLVGTEQPGTSKPERYWSRRVSLWLKPPVQNTTPRRARMRCPAPAVTPTTSPASFVSTPSTGWPVRMSTPRSRAAISMRRVNSTPSPGSPSGSCGMTTRPKGTLSISFPCRKAEGRVPRPVQGGPCEAREVGHGVLARVRDALLLHEVVVGDLRPGGGLAPGPAQLLGGLEQDGRRAELR